MKKLLFISFLFISLASFGQTARIVGDSLKVYQTGGGSAELILENSTRGLTGGYLQNKNNGRTQFKYALDSVWQAGDLLQFRYGPSTLSFNIIPPGEKVDSITHPSGIDSFYYWINGVPYAVKDSTGGAGIDTIGLRNDSAYYKVLGAEKFAFEKRNNTVRLFHDATESIATRWTTPTADTALTITADTIDFHSTTVKDIRIYLKDEAGADTLWNLSEKWVMSMDVTLRQFYANNNDGFFVGERNRDYGVYDRWGFTIKAHGGSTAILLPWVVFDGSNLTTTQQMDISNGDKLRITVTKNLNRFSLKIINLTKSTEVYNEFKVGAGGPGGNYTIPTLVRAFHLTLQQGSFEIYNVSVRSLDGASDVMFIGNSITIKEDGYPVLYKNWFQKYNVSVNAGSSSTTGDVIRALPSIIKSKPRNIVMMIGTNDISGAVPTATIRTNIQNIVSDLESEGIDVTLTTLTPRDNSDVRSHNAWLYSTFPGQVIDLFTPIADAGTYTLNDVYESDDVHPNSAGHIRLFEKLRDSLDFFINRNKEYLSVDWADIPGSVLDNIDLRSALNEKVFGTFSTAANGRIPYVSGQNRIITTSNLFYDETNIRLGVGTSTPSNGIHLVSSVNNSTAGQIKSENTNANGTASFGTINNSGYGISLTAFGSTYSGTSLGETRAGNVFLSSSGGTMFIGTGTANDIGIITNNARRMTISSAGTVTIPNLAGTGTRVMLASSTGLTSALANSTDGFVLKLVSGTPTWAAETGGGAVTTLAAIGSTPNANGATISGSTLNLEPASGSFGGIVSTGVQIFNGQKTWLSTQIFSSAIQTNAPASSANFWVGTGNTGTTGSPGSSLEFAGATSIGARAWSRGSNAFGMGVGSTNANWIFGNQVFTEAASGTHSMVANVVFKGQTITDGAAATTDAANVYIEGPPTGTATVTNPVYSLWVGSGTSRFGGDLNIDLTKKINIGTGTDASIGVSGAMTAGTITISTTAVTANSKIFLTHATLGGAQGSLSVGTITAGTSFVINSSSNTDTGTVNWWIIN